MKGCCEIIFRNRNIIQQMRINMSNADRQDITISAVLIITLAVVIFSGVFVWVDITI